MKFNWGTGIAIVYSVFVLGMVGAVIASRQHDPGLVRKDYYDLDIHYQEHYDKKQNAANLSEGLPVRFDTPGKMITLQFPVRLGQPTGKVKLFRSATAENDHYLDVKTNPDGSMEIPAADLDAGIWHLEIDWTAGGKQYFNTSIVTVIHA